MRAERTEYAIPGWGVGTLWTDGDGLVLEHELAFTNGAQPRAGACAGVDRAAEIVARVQAFLAGREDTLADVPIDLGWCTPFQHAVTAALRAVPRGEVVSYGELAALAGYPGAQRAVGTYCALNRFALLVPCHRVVAAGGIGGYGAAGVAVKRRLLALEGVRL